LLQTIFPNCVRSNLKIKDLAVAFIRRTEGSSLWRNVDYWFPVTRPMLLSSLSFSKYSADLLLDLLIAGYCWPNRYCWSTDFSGSIFLFCNYVIDIFFVMVCQDRFLSLIRDWCGSSAILRASGDISFIFRISAVLSQAYLWFFSSVTAMGQLLFFFCI
jgi:hypothetical protein